MDETKSFDPPALTAFDERRAVDGAGDRYTVGGEIGRGGMGVVHLCHDGRLRRDVAVKIDAERRPAGGQPAWFEREARIQGQLEHPSVVPVYDMGTTDTDRLFFTMKHVRGRTLKSILSSIAEDDDATRSSFGLRRLLSAFTSVCNAVAVAHSKGIVHRDLKPSNIMLGEYGEVYVLDWGVATVASDRRETADWSVDLRDDELTRAGPNVVGTPRYMAPEQRDGVATARSDVYALGRVLREVLDVWAAKGEQIDPQLVAAADGAAAIDPDERCETAEELRDGVEAYLDVAHDEARRVELSNRHAAEARSLADAAAAPDSHRRAMREVARALALDPTNAGAMRTFVQLLDRPPETVPDEVQRALVGAGDEGRRRSSAFAGLNYIAVVLLLPLAMWAGETDLVRVVIVSAAWLLAIGAFFATGRRWPSSQAGMLPTLVLTSTATALTSLVTGWIILVPVLATTNTSSFAMQLDKRWRVLSASLGCASVVVPAAIAALTPITVASDPGWVFPTLHGELAAPVWVFIVASALALNVGVTIFFGGYRDGLENAQKGLLLRSWQLRQLTAAPPKAARLGSR